MRRQIYLIWFVIGLGLLTVGCAPTPSGVAVQPALTRMLSGTVVGERPTSEATETAVLTPTATITAVLRGFSHAFASWGWGLR